MMNYRQFFKSAVGQESPPFEYQLSLAVKRWPDILHVPTGSGKTAAVIVAWLYKRLHGDVATPRRLVYCLPEHALVEQIAIHARGWIENLNIARVYRDGAQPQVHTLTGGETADEWDGSPEADQILIGTQEQLVSRALNRGYAMSLFRWPVHFALLNNDCLWVMDEIQLMGNCLATTVQLQAFRNAFKTQYPVYSLWMTAILQMNWVGTVDFLSGIEDLHVLSVGKKDMNSRTLSRRLQCSRPLSRISLSSSDPRVLARFTVENHQSCSRTIVVLNTVERAQSLYRQVRKMNTSAELILIHSSFRPIERELLIDKLLASPSGGGMICIMNQVVEAGIDVDSRTLITELAPWASLVQRFGRCNRYGNDHEAKIFWIDIDTSKKNASVPYPACQLDRAREQLEALHDAGIQDLPRFEENPPFHHVIRRKDLIDLFDTTPDLAGVDMDVSKIIRSTDEQRVQVFWRKLPDGRPKPEESFPVREELCNVSISSIPNELKKWKWDHLDRSWVSVSGREIHPGMMLLLDADAGGYSEETGWTGKTADRLSVVCSSGLQPPPAYDDDSGSISNWTEISEHSDKVVHELRNLLHALDFTDGEIRRHLEDAARWHDAGKAHKVFQEAITGGRHFSGEDRCWAKSPAAPLKYSRKGFRHELASALAMLDARCSDISAYLAASHHGKVRLSIRSLPHESYPVQDISKRFARGIRDGDVLPETDLGGGVVMQETVLDLSVMELGQGSKGESWLGRMLQLRDSPGTGPFKLAYYETLIRVADRRGSRETGNSHA